MRTSLSTYKSVILTIDLEDWFQVENFKDCISFSEWNRKEWRFEYATNILLELFDRWGIKATFFVLGWNAEKVPHLIRKIAQLGHEIASHGYRHDRCVSQPSMLLYQDLKNSKDILEQIIGKEVSGYRAPSFSVDNFTIDLLKNLKFSYDSSFNSFALNRRYGTLDLQQYRKNGIVYRDRDGFFELPISNLEFRHLVLPWGGGGYFRLLPGLLFSLGMKFLLKKHRCYLFYLHPWEIDFAQPRVSQGKWFSIFRHYCNQKGCLAKLEALIAAARGCTFLTCSEYLQGVPWRRRYDLLPGGSDADPATHQ